ncbi:glycogen synthase [Chloroflexia bacterium SDU3-3]|nr:glycogen synthase [Chloroflexia bacterium SDU3-3]
MNILYVAAEMSPLIKTGGLADVASALPAALRKLGHDARVVVPCYHQARFHKALQTPACATSFLPVGERQEIMRIHTTQQNGIPIYLLDIPTAFERGAIYGEADDDRRFILFARGVMALMLHLRDIVGWPIDVVHANDWHCGLVPNYLKTYYRYAFGNVASVFTAHNLAYQGLFSPFTLHLSGLGEGGLIERNIGLAAQNFNFLARGLLFADIINTISPTYSVEILTPDQSEGLHPLLQMRHERLAGIMHGIDYGIFDPETDPALAANYSAADTNGKRLCKAALQQEVGLEVDIQRPLIGVPGPLTLAHGIDLVIQALPWLIDETDAQMVLQGSGDSIAQQVLRSFADQHPDRIQLLAGTDPELAHQLYAGCDTCLIPPLRDPGGTDQLIALRYGCVPVVHAVGGLNDTVREGYDGNGFRFHAYQSRDLIDAIRRSITSYSDAAGWKHLRQRGMSEDNSWLASAREYIGLYDWAQRVI